MHAARPCFQRILEGRLVLVASLGWLAGAHAQAPADPLPSWNDGAAKKSIIDFVARVDDRRAARTSCRSTSASPPSTTTARCGPSSRCTSSSPSRSTASRRWRRKHPGMEEQAAVQGACSTATCKALAALGREGLARDHGGHPRRHDHRGIRQDRRRTGSPPRGIRASTGPTPSSSISRCSSCSPICAPTASRPSSSPAAASSSCARGRRGPTAFRPSRWSARPASTKFQMRRDGKPVLMKLAARSSSSTTGRASRSASTASSAGGPIFAFGNSDGDQQMLEWTAAGERRRASWACRAPHRRRARMGLRPQVARRQARQGARRGGRARLDRGRHEARLEEGVSVRPVKARAAAFPAARLCFPLALLHEAFLGGAGEGSAVAANRLDLTGVALALLEEAGLGGARQRLTLLADGLALAGLLRRSDAKGSATGPRQGQGRE